MEINLTVPGSWNELSQQQLAFLLATITNMQGANESRRFRSLEDYSAQMRAEIAVCCLCRWTGLEVVSPYGEGFIMRYDGVEFVLSPEELAAAVAPLDWIREIPATPVRLDAIGKALAAEADLSDLSFEDFIACDNLWQGYHATGDNDLLRQMAGVLYRCDGIAPEPHEILGVFYWWVAAKTRLAAMYPHFFRPAEATDGSAAPDYDSLRRNADTQIRALTKGDVSKEAQVLAAGCWRALAELDAQAREYEELNRKYKHDK